MRVILLLLALVACTPPSPAAVPGLKGASRAAAIARFGKPLSVSEVPFDTPLEFYRVALDKLPADLVGVNGLKVESLRWRDGEFHVAAFVARKPGGRWVVIDSIRWHDTIVIG